MASSESIEAMWSRQFIKLLFKFTHFAKIKIVVADHSEKEEGQLSRWLINTRKARSACNHACNASVAPHRQTDSEPGPS